ncbi:MAG: hypothetical protein LBG58_04495 [Planctomycetaceae bacterium]|jgi:hypothetical protein|nr:hypothetical protein [Planctomycetaceae bacterium]
MNFYRFSFLFIGTIFILTGMVYSAPSASLLPGQIARQTPSGGLIFRCLFDRSSDAENEDGWPDYWTRKSGIDQGILFPEYLEISIVENNNNFGNHSLRMNVEGGGAAVFSPKIPIRQGMSYIVSAYVDAVNFVHDDIFILLAFYGEKTAEPLQTIASEKIRNTNGWRRLEIGPIIADASGIQSVAVGLLVIPSGRQDYGARVDFTNVEIRESPSVSLSMPNENHLFFHPRNIDVGCRIQGIDPAQHTASFVLEDPFGRVIAKRDIELMVGSKPASQFVVAEKDKFNVFQGTAIWRGLPILSPGFYRVRVSTPESFIKNLKLPDGVFFEDPLDDAEPLTFVVTSSGSFISGGDFGWNLDGWTLEEINRRLPILTQSGISKLKIPAWFPSGNEKQYRMLNELCDVLSRRRVQVVGLLHPVPDEIRSKIQFGPVNAASVFSLAPSIWSDPLQPTLHNLALLVKDWQWTSDDDLSITEIPGFAQHFEELRRSFDRNDLGFGVGFAWSWEQALPERFSTPNTTTALRSVNEFVALTSSESLSSDDFAQYLAGTEGSRIRRFVSLKPLSEQDYLLEDRINDLVRRMVMGKINAEALFLSRPLDNQTGVLRSNVTPGELFLPWRITAAQISGRSFLGSISLPNQSRNYNFDLGGGKAVMVVWNDRASSEKPIRETLYLGTEPEILNVWGKRFPPEQQGREQIIPVTSTPVFVTNIHSGIVRLRLGIQLGVKEIPSVINQKNPIPFSVKNGTEFPVAVQISPVSPRPGHWIIDPPTQTLALDVGAVGNGTFNLSLTARANTDRRPIQINVKTQGPDPQEFSVYDEIQIGNREVYMEFSSQLNQNGDLEVTQTFVNDTENVYTYSCQLIVPDRPMRETTVRSGLGRLEHVYLIRRGRELIANGVTEMTVRARPVGTVQPVGQPMVYTIPLLSD